MVLLGVLVVCVCDSWFGCEFKKEVLILLLEEKYTCTQYMRTGSD